jgi:phosphoribulokinase
MMERGHSLESIQASIEARKPDFDAYIGPQRSQADCVLQVIHAINRHYEMVCTIL